MEYAYFPVTGGSGGIASINGNTASAQTIAAGTGISVSSSGGTTTITNTGSAGVAGPGSSTNHALASWNGTSGALLANNPTLLALSSGLGLLVGSNSNMVISDPASTPFANLTTGMYNTGMGANGVFGGLTSGNLNTAFGWGNLTGMLSGMGNTALGVGNLTADMGGFENIAIGYASGTSITSGSNNILVGASVGASVSTGSGNILFGTNADILSSLSTSNQLVFSPIAHVLMGNGWTNASPLNLDLNATSGVGSNIAGANFVIAAGASTGSAAGGTISFKTSPAGAAGSTPNALSTPLSLTASYVTSSVPINGGSAAAGDLTLSSTSNASKGWVRLNDSSGLLIDGDPSNSIESYIPSLISAGSAVVTGTSDLAGGQLFIANCGNGYPPTLYAYSSAGTFASPVLIGNSTPVGIFQASTWAGTSTYDNQTGVGSIQFVTTQTHTTSAKGTSLAFFTTANGTAGQRLAGLIGQDSSFTLGASSATPQHTLHTSTATPASGAGTFTNLPTGYSGNPTGYVQITINGGTHVIPYW